MPFPTAYTLTINTYWNVTVAYCMIFFGGGVDLYFRSRSNPDFYAKYLLRLIYMLQLAVNVFLFFFFFFFFFFLSDIVFLFYYI